MIKVDLNQGWPNLLHVKASYNKLQMFESPQARATRGGGDEERKYPEPRLYPINLSSYLANNYKASTFLFTFRVNYYV